MDFLVRGLHERLSAQIHALEVFLGAEKGSVVLTDNATTGVNSVMGSLGLKRGETVLLSNQAYFSTRNALEVTANAAGARVRRISFSVPAESPETLVRNVMDAVDSSVRYAVLDHISSPTGIVFPISRISRALRERGVETVVDGAHGPGHIPLRLSETGCAWYIGNCHKWLCSPRTAAIIYTRPDMSGVTRPVVVSHLPRDFAPGPDPRRVMFDWSGTPDPTPKLSVKFTLEHMASLHPDGWSGIMAHNHHLAVTARNLLLNAVGGEPICPESMVGCMAAVLLPPAPPPDPLPIHWIDPLQNTLREMGFEVPVIHCSSGRFLRVSAQLYNRREQYEQLAHALKHAT